MIGKIFITRSGYDPQLGKHVNDPYLDNPPSLGACRPDIRRRLAKGDHIFVISGKVQEANQFVMGGFEIDQQIDARDAYVIYPDQRLHLLPDGQVTGNVIIDSRGRQHRLDMHSDFARRLSNYTVGKNLLALKTPAEISRGREETLEILREVFGRKGASPWEIVGRWGSDLTDTQILQLREWLEAIKKADN